MKTWTKLTMALVDGYICVHYSEGGRERVEVQLFRVMFGHNLKAQAERRIPQFRLFLPWPD
jgi:hypothetical protein